jgi:hypothetical protein
MFQLHVITAQPGEKPRKFFVPRKLFGRYCTSNYRTGMRQEMHVLQEEAELLHCTVMKIGELLEI